VGWRLTVVRVRVRVPARSRAPSPGLQPESEVTALLVAAEHGHVELVRQLIELRADITRTSSSGNTALHFAARSPNTAVLTLLHDAGANCAVACAAHLLRFAPADWRARWCACAGKSLRSSFLAGAAPVLESLAC